MTTEDPKGRAFYVTSAIPYVNAAPHLGFAFELVLADAIARHHRLKGRDVRFQTGTDENSLKNALAADRAGVPVARFVGAHAAKFETLKEPLGLSFDDFIRTSTDPRHRVGVRTLWRRLAAQGDLYRGVYEGLYCIGCEQFYDEADLVDGRCPEHETPLERISEENYFFRLSRYAEPVERLIRSSEIEILPEVRRNEVLKFIERGLEDFSVSRSAARARGWGLRVPDDPGEVIYVWFDALGNYLTALDYGGDGRLFRRYWRECADRVHVIGKGITRFHALYWPAILLAAGLPPPTRILVHGYVTIGGRKISKSRGHDADPLPLAHRHGTDALRYFLLRHIRTGEDGDFSIERFDDAYRTELADGLGNLVSRTLGLIDRYSDGVAPDPAAAGPLEDAFARQVAGLPAQIDEAFARFRLHDGLAAVWKVIRGANAYVNEAAPWALARARDATRSEAVRRDTDRALRRSLFVLSEAAVAIGRAIGPFLPETSSKIASVFGVEDGEATPVPARRASGRVSLFPKD